VKEKTSRKKNTLFLLAVFVLVNILVRGPDLVKAINKPPDKWYAGQASWFDPWDINQYFAVIGWGKRNGLLFENLYDTEPHPGAPVFPLYTSLGRLTSSLNLSNASIFHLSGAIVSFFVVGIAWWFIKIFLKDELEKKIALLLLFLGGGFGWVSLVFADVLNPSFTLVNALRRPHEGISLILFLVALGSFWLGGTRQKNRFLFWGILASFLMLLFHPHKLILLAVCLGIFGFYWWWQEKSLVFFKILLVLALEGVVYFLGIGQLIANNPSFSGLTTSLTIRQSSSPFSSAIGGWGFLSAFIIMAYFLKNQEKEMVFFKIWFLSHWFLTYFPFYFQRDLTKGLWVPAMVLAVKGVRWAFPKTQNYQKAIIILLVLASFSSLLVFTARITIMPKGRWIYLARQEGEIIEFLENHGNNEEGVLADFRVSNLIPAQTTKRVWAGHRFQTPNFNEREEEVNQFFAGEMSQVEAKAFLAKTRSVWVFWGPDEKEIANLSEIPYQKLLEPVMKNPIASLYRVK
jgi:hypothetical protein